MAETRIYRARPNIQRIQTARSRGPWILARNFLCLTTAAFRSGLDLKPNRRDLPPAVRVGGLYTTATQPVNTWNGPRENNFAQLQNTDFARALALLLTVCRTARRCKTAPNAQRPPDGGRCWSFRLRGSIRRPLPSGDGGGAPVSAFPQHRWVVRWPSGRRISPSPWRSSRHAVQPPCGVGAACRPCRPE